MRQLSTGVSSLVIVLGLLMPVALGSSYSFELKAADCTPAPPPNGAEGTPDPNWVPYTKFIQSCPVFGPDHKVVLKILTVRTDLMMKMPNADAVEDVVNSQIVGADGKLLGTLIGTFPVEYPATVRIDFTNWQNNFPQIITTHFKDTVGLGSPGGNDTIFLWNKKDGDFERQPWQTQ